ncbi:hypothetical protein HU200_061297 [Digitaria exilis]|uniref:Thaumatin-like protein n=1 Tax=Digitaria exilis TaxID=1010633 RepID=A0A835A9D0_9POAL|nr:hypothetical protein HU200_061297 [Digitaria exilis]
MAATFAFRNNCHVPIYPGVLTNPDRPAFPTSGFMLLPKTAIRYHSVPPNWAGRIWPRHRCVPSGEGGLSCHSGDCAGRLQCSGAGGQAPSTVAEFTLSGHDGKDFYDISNVDGFNIPLQIVPAGAGCATVTCGADIVRECPPDLEVKAPDGAKVGCKSGCLAFNTDELCCRGAYGTPDRCRPSGYSQFFKQRCPQAYSYAYDDGSSTFTCPTGADYQIVEDQAEG